MQSIIELLLERFERVYLRVVPLLAQLVAKTSPSEADATFLRNRVPNNWVTIQYFFDALSTAAWLEPLEKKHYFLDPPPPDFDESECASCHGRSPDICCA